MSTLSTCPLYAVTESRLRLRTYVSLKKGRYAALLFASSERWHETCDTAPVRTKLKVTNRKLQGVTMQTQRGFTLIELMIVVAIIAILAAIAISQYQDYVIRTQVAEGSSLASGMKTAVTEFYNSHGRFAGNNASYGLAQAGSIRGKYVDQVDATGGVIAAKFGSGANIELQGEDLVFSPVTHPGSIEWICNRSNNLKEKYVPTVCRN